MKFHFKKMKFIYETLFSPSFDVLHSSPIVYMDHTELIIQDLLLYCAKKVQENHSQFFHFCHGGETHYLVLAQTLIDFSTNKPKCPHWWGKKLNLKICNSKKIVWSCLCQKYEKKNGSRKLKRFSFSCKLSPLKFKIEHTK